MFYTDSQATQIAELINAYNQLPTSYSAESVKQHADRYQCLINTETQEIGGCVSVHKIQWYQAEISHLAIGEQYQRQKFATILVARAEDIARQLGCSILQCTIRRNNRIAFKFFRSCGFELVNEFYNQATKNRVLVLQKEVKENNDKPLLRLPMWFRRTYNAIHSLARRKIF
jgi:ribosomal protein S18 acetylase RimI-like enzyme